MDEDRLNHLSDQFHIAHQGETPLRYDKGRDIQRFGVINPEATLPDEPKRAIGSEAHIRETDYWNPKFIATRGASGKPLARPKKFNNPSAAAPGTVAFADVQPMGDDAYIHFVNTRRDQRGQGHARRLVDHIADQFAGTLHFGKVMNPGMWKLKEELDAKGRSTLGHRDF